MFNTKEINDRFFSCVEGKTQREIAELFHVGRSTVSQWAIGVRQVPWDKLKKLRDSQCLNWDWLLEGKGNRNRFAGSTSSEHEYFDTPAINQRFLSLFSEMTQEQLATLLDITQSAVSGWKIFDRQVPWEKLKYAVENKNVSWEWLIEG